MQVSRDELIEILSRMPSNYTFSINEVKLSKPINPYYLNISSNSYSESVVYDNIAILKL